MMDIANERSERLLVLLLLQSMKGNSQQEKIKQLNMAGFSNIEIAEFLQISPSAIAAYFRQSEKPNKSRMRKQ